MKSTMSGRMTWGKLCLSLMAMAGLVGLLPVGIAQAADSKTLQVTAGEAVAITIQDVTAVGIAEPAIADVVKMGETPVFSIIGKKPGVTTLTVVHADGETELHRVEVAHSAGVRSIHQAVGSPHITVQEIGDAVVLEGKVKTELEAERAVRIASAYKGNVVNLIEVTSPRRVKIRGRLVEVRTDAIKRLGIKFFGPNGEVRYAYGRGSIVEGGDSDVAGHGFLDPLDTDPQTISATTAPLAVEARLRALAEKDLAKTLSEPTLITLSGKEASFLSGGEVPIVQQLAQSFTVEFKEFGVRMKIKPVVDSENNITSHVMAEVSDVAGVGAAGIPTFRTRRAETEVQVADGQTIVIGGLLSNQRLRDAIRKVPWLGDIPVLGVLFRSKDYQHGISELLVFVTLEVLKDIGTDVAQAAVTPPMKKWHGGEAEEELRQEPKPDPRWQKPLEVDELKVTPEAPAPANPAADAPAADSTGKTVPAQNFNAGQPAGK